MSIYISPKSPNKKKSKFKPSLTIDGKRYEPINERKRKREESYKDKKKLGREKKMIKSDVEGKSLNDTLNFFGSDLNMQSQFLPRATSAPYPEKIKVRGKKENSILMTKFSSIFAKSPSMLLARLLHAKLVKKIPF